MIGRGGRQSRSDRRRIKKEQRRKERKSKARKTRNTRRRRAREEIPRTMDRPIERQARPRHDDGPPLRIDGGSRKQVRGDRPQISPEDVIRNIQNQRRKRT